MSVRNRTDPSVTRSWDGRLLLTPGAAVYSGPGGDADPHSHHAVQLIRSFDSPFRLETDTFSVSATAALIPSGVRHSIRSDSGRLLIALIEPLGPKGSQLNRVAGDRLGKNLELATVDESVSAMPPERVATSYIDSLTSSRPQPRPISPHVTSALRYLDESVKDRPVLEDAAGAAGISPSRLTHLFTKEVGIPFRRYVLWLRFRKVAEAIVEGDNLTGAAMAAGFSDSSHLSRSFRDHFGLSPSALLHMKVTAADWPG